MYDREPTEWRPVDVVRSIYELSKLAVTEVIMGKPVEPVPFQRIPITHSEAPVTTEEELND